MAQTTVYGCDWCKEIVGKDKEDKPRFAAKIVATQLWPFPPMGEGPKKYDICDTCKTAFDALTQGKFRRAG